MYDLSWLESFDSMSFTDIHRTLVFHCISAECHAITAQCCQPKQNQAPGSGGQGQVVMRWTSAMLFDVCPCGCMILQVG